MLILGHERVSIDKGTATKLRIWKESLDCQSWFGPSPCVFGLQLSKLNKYGLNSETGLFPNLKGSRVVTHFSVSSSKEQHSFESFAKSLCSVFKLRTPSRWGEWMWEIWLFPGSLWCALGKKFPSWESCWHSQVAKGALSWLESSRQRTIALALSCQSGEVVLHFIQRTKWSDKKVYNSDTDTINPFSTPSPIDQS